MKTYDGRDVEVTFGGVPIAVESIEFTDGVAGNQYERRGRWYTLKSPRYPGEGNRLARRTAAKGKVRK